MPTPTVEAVVVAPVVVVVVVAPVVVALAEVALLEGEDPLLAAARAARVQVIAQAIRAVPVAAVTRQPAVIRQELKATKAAVQTPRLPETLVVELVADPAEAEARAAEVAPAARAAEVAPAARASEVVPAARVSELVPARALPAVAWAQAQEVDRPESATRRRADPTAWAHSRLNAVQVMSRPYRTAAQFAHASTSG